MSRLILIAIACLTSVAHAELVPLPPQPADVPWPTTGWPTAPLPETVNAGEFQAAMADVFDKHTLGDTREVVVIYGGRLVHEQYGPGYTPETRLVSWSMAKSITQALVGVAVQQGKVNIDTPMGSPHWAPDDRRAQIPWRLWLQMTDGQRYLEIDAPSISQSDASQKLFGDGRLDVAKYCSGLPLIHEPGTHWNYNSCGIVLASDALTRTIVPNPTSPTERRASMSKWMHENLYDVIGMKAQPEFDASGLFYGSAFVYASARDFAKFGLLYLRDGVWEGRRILPEGWVDYARSPGTGKNADIYGAGWWITPAEGPGRPYPSAIDSGPQRDSFRAQGFEGQITLLVPSKDLIIVRLGLIGEAREQWAELSRWLGRVARTFPGPPAPAAQVSQSSK